MRIINSAQHGSVAIIGTPTIHPLGLSIFYPNGQALVTDTFVPTTIKATTRTNMSIRPTLNRFFYAYIFGMLPIELVITGLILRNQVEVEKGDIKLKTLKPIQEISSILTTASAGYLGLPLIVTVASDGISPNTDNGFFIGFLSDFLFEFYAESDLLGWFAMKLVGPAPKPLTTL